MSRSQARHRARLARLAAVPFAMLMGIGCGGGSDPPVDGQRTGGEGGQTEADIDVAPALLADGRTHFMSAGAAAIAKLVAQGVRDLGLPLEGYLR